MSFDKQLYQREWYQRNKDSHKSSTRTRKLEKQSTDLGRAEYAISATRTDAKRRGYTPCLTPVEVVVDGIIGKCHICGIPEAECSKRLALDHDHQTGEYRGWLCGTCNRGIGIFRDNAQALENAATYLTKNSYLAP